MLLPCFDVLCALSENRPTAKWNLFVLYNNQDFWPHFVSEHHVERLWAESKTFKQSCDPLNCRIILKNISPTLISKLTFIPEEILDPKILQQVSRFTDCDLWSITRHYRISIGVFWTTCLTRHNKVPAFLTWLRLYSQWPLSNFSSHSFSFQRNLPVFVCYSKKQFAKLCWPVTLPGLWTDHVRRSHHLMLSIVRLYSNHTPLDQSKCEFYTVHCINSYSCRQ